MIRRLRSWWRELLCRLRGGHHWSEVTWRWRMFELTREVVAWRDCVRCGRTVYCCRRVSERMLVQAQSPDWVISRTENEVIASVIEASQ